jgi:hypothetical protein
MWTLSHMQEMEIKPEKEARAQVLQLHLISDLENFSPAALSSPAA